MPRSLPSSGAPSGNGGPYVPPPPDHLASLHVRLLCPVGSCDEYVNPGGHAIAVRILLCISKIIVVFAGSAAEFRDRPCRGARTSGAPLRHRPISLAAINSCCSWVSPCCRRKNRERRRHVPPNEHMPGSYHCAKGSRAVAVQQVPPLRPDSRERIPLLRWPARSQASVFYEGSFDHGAARADRDSQSVRAG